MDEKFQGGGHGQCQNQVLTLQKNTAEWPSGVILTPHSNEFQEQTPC